VRASSTPSDHKTATRCSPIAAEESKKRTKAKRPSSPHGDETRLESEFIIIGRVVAAFFVACKPVLGFRAQLPVGGGTTATTRNWLSGILQKQNHQQPAFGCVSPCCPPPPNLHATADSPSHHLSISLAVLLPPHVLAAAAAAADAAAVAASSC